MSTDRSIVEMIEILQGNNSGNQTLLIASVQSTSPFSLKMFDMTISKNIYANSSASFKSGDTVVVYRTGVSFYVLESVVKVS